MTTNEPNRKKASAKYVVSLDRSKFSILSPEDLLRILIGDITEELIDHILEKSPSTIDGGYEIRIEVVPVDE